MVCSSIFSAKVAIKNLFVVIVEKKIKKVRELIKVLF